MKAALLSLIASGGGFAPFRIARRRQALIVTYHRFTSGGGADATTADALAAQLAYLTGHYRVVPLSWLAARLERGASPAGAAAVTVDDGYRDVYEVAFPLFRRYAVPATVFAVTGFLDGACWIWTDQVRYIVAHTSAADLEIEMAGHRLAMPLHNRDDRRRAALRANRLLKTVPDAVKDDAIASLADRLRVPLPARPPGEMGPLEWSQVTEMAAAGVEFGSHTVTHPMLTQVDEQRLAGELAASRERLGDALSRPPDLFCYPNGGVDDRVRAAVARAGYRAAVTTVPGFNGGGADPFLLRRIHTERDLPHFIQSTSGFEALKTQVRARLP